MLKEMDTGYIRGIVLINNLNHSGNYGYHLITVSFRNSAFCHTRYSYASYVS